MKKWGLLLLLFTLPFMVAKAEREGLLNQLLAPGPLILGHKELEESRCLDCHDVGKGIVENKCLKCHKEIQVSKLKVNTFHGLATKTCIACHTDHKGRELDTTKVDSSNFNHKVTGFSLEGAHGKIKCQECHTEKRTSMKVRKQDPHFLGSSKTCNSCHIKDDPHHFKGKNAEAQCSTCHSETTWKSDLKFDHNKDTKFELVEAHSKLKCMECHQNKQKEFQYQWPQLGKMKCLSCHTDFHKNSFSPKVASKSCLSCHSQTKWTIEKFDHSKFDFDLKGKHAELKCIDCHKQKNPSAGQAIVSKVDSHIWKGLKKNCNSCHNDVHFFGSFQSKQLGLLNRCETCHNEKEWKPKVEFDHNKQTNFTIDGKHSDLKCVSCHVPNRATLTSKTLLPQLKSNKSSLYHFNELNAKTCNTCHSNPHLGVFSDKRAKMSCTTCHTTDGWDLQKGEGKFDHTKTRFSLLGAHAKVECKSCHLKEGKNLYKFDLSKQAGCIACHENIHLNDMSSKFSSKSCLDCHNQDKWKVLENKNYQFDHSITRFALTGKHIETKCVDCHKEKTLHHRQFLFSKADQKFCISCHDNVHKDQFSKELNSKSCSTCHTTQNFTNRLQFDHSTTEYPLRGKHMDLKCSLCHTTQKDLAPFPSGHKKGKFLFPQLESSECTLCHKDEHKGQFGNICSKCHSEKSWEATRDFHKNFMLSGIHLTLTCNECHTNNRHLSGTSTNCLFCHRKDDVHHGSLPNCGTCHNQNFWDARMFQHSRTRFPLRGVHRTLECLDCHNRGIYKGTPSDCFSCHMNDAMNASSFSHAPIGSFTDCTSCHKNHFSFENAK